VDISVSVSFLDELIVGFVSLHGSGLGFLGTLRGQLSGLLGIFVSASSRVGDISGSSSECGHLFSVLSGSLGTSSGFIRSGECFSNGGLVNSTRFSRSEVGTSDKVSLGSVSSNSSFLGSIVGSEGISSFLVGCGIDVVSIVESSSGSVSSGKLGSSFFLGSDGSGIGGGTEGLGSEPGLNLGVSDDSESFRRVGVNEGHGLVVVPCVLGVEGAVKVNSLRSLDLKGLGGNGDGGEGKGELHDCCWGCLLLYLFKPRFE